MTGYGNAEIQTNSFRIRVEMKSLNGKYLELNLRSPKFMGEHDLNLRNHLNRKLVRGSVLVNVYLERTEENTEDVQLNTKLAESYYRAFESFANSVNSSKEDLLKLTMTQADVVMSEESTISDQDAKAILDCADVAFDQLDAFRIEEGAELKKLLMGHSNAISDHLLPALAAHEKDRLNLVKTRLMEGIEEQFGEGDYDKNRYEQELIYYLEKLDISEEKNRLAAHCRLFEQEIERNPSGKKLGFISQEMGREINTLGSKANYAPIQKVVIEMKEELEKIKEQVLNVL